MQIVESKVLKTARMHGHPAQFYVVLTDIQGNKTFLWMIDADYYDWIEDQIAVHGLTDFDPSTYQIP